jgi:Flp pilus assembly protein TadD
MNDKAWYLATTPAAANRDGSNAVQLAEKVVEMTKHLEPAFLDTLAAAYAETGEFERAAATENQAIALLKTENEKHDYASRLTLYQRKMPYHEEH